MPLPNRNECQTLLFKSSSVLSTLCQVIVLQQSWQLWRIEKTSFVLLIVPSLHPLPPAASHHRLSRESQAQRGLPRGGREAHQGGQQHHAGRLWSAWQDGQVWRREEAVCDSKWKRKPFCVKSAKAWKNAFGRTSHNFPKNQYPKPLLRRCIIKF